MSAVLLEYPAKHVALLRINRPDALNALNAEVREIINTTLPILDQDPEIRCVVLAGSEKAFAAGADIKERSTMSAVDVMKMSTTRGIAAFSKPLSAACDFAAGEDRQHQEDDLQRDHSAIPRRYHAITRAMS